MQKNPDNKKLTLIVPCFNEEKTLQKCIHKVVGTLSGTLKLEIIIVDDCSKDGSLTVARQLSQIYECVRTAQHSKNQGKGAAIKTGVKLASGDFIGVQDADLEYDPQDLIKMVIPLLDDEADVVLGSRFLSAGCHRVLYFWHSLGNAFLTFLSNMFTDLNLTDMECCYKLFKKEIIKNIDLKESRFGFEPEIVARVAHMRVRIFEMGVSYKGRTYEEGKKIGVKDGIRALYCIIRYNANKAPVPMQFLFYTMIGGIAALSNLIIFTLLMSMKLSVEISALSAFWAAAVLNYFLCILTVFKHNARWNTIYEVLIFIGIVAAISIVDLQTTKVLLNQGFSTVESKLLATAIGLILNFAGRKYLVFSESLTGDWQAQEKD